MPASPSSFSASASQNYRLINFDEESILRQAEEVESDEPKVVSMLKSGSEGRRAASSPLAGFGVSVAFLMVD